MSYDGPIKVGMRFQMGGPPPDWYKTGWGIVEITETFDHGVWAKPIEPPSEYYEIERFRAAAHAQPSETKESRPWRVGHKVRLNVYRDDWPICQCHDEQTARFIVEACNRYEQQPVRPALRTCPCPQLHPTPALRTVEEVAREFAHYVEPCDTLDGEEHLLICDRVTEKLAALLAADREAVRAQVEADAAHDWAAGTKIARADERRKVLERARDAILARKAPYADTGRSNTHAGGTLDAADVIDAMLREEPPAVADPPTNNPQPKVDTDPGSMP